MSKQDTIELTAIVISHVHDLFLCSLDNEFHQEIKARLSGKMRLNKINLMPGDYVKLEVSPYDLSLGRIVSRLKQDKRSTVAPTEDTQYVDAKKQPSSNQTKRSDR